jgi:hypothetical protein
MHKILEKGNKRVIELKGCVRGEKKKKKAFLSNIVVTDGKN